MVCDFMDSDAKDASTIEGEDNDDAANIVTNFAPPPPPQKKSRQTDKQRNELANTPKKDKEQEQPFFFFLYNKLIFIKINCLNYFFVILIESLSLLILLMENS